MSAATAPAAGASRGTAPAAGGGTLVGTGILLRFMLRRDRIRIPVWLGALFLGTVASAASFKGTYPTAADQAAAARTVDSPAGLAMSGPAGYLDDYNIGAMMGHQMISFTGVLVGLMSVLIITRHTRTEEETGRAELVRATVVGRHAQLTAALLLAAVVNVALALLFAAGLSWVGGTGVTWNGSLLYGAAHAALGIVFAAVAAVTVQITAHSRGASGMALAAIGAAYALRASGDVGTEALSWMSPIGWAQRTYVYVDDRWWPLLLALVLAAAAAAAGYALSTRRDVGSGLRAGRAGRPVASASLLHPVGFAFRLHRGLLIGFGAGLFVLGVMYGSVIGDIEDMVADIEEFQEMMEELGGTISRAYASMVLIVLSIVASIHVVMATQRTRAEETGGRTEPLLATALSRARWAGSHLVVALVGGTVVLLLAGLGFGIAGSAAGEDGLLLETLGAALAYVPALWVTAGLAITLFGWLPRAGTAVWIVPVYAFVVGYLGELLRFPDWLNNLSPFGHVPRLPATGMNWTPLVILTLVAAGLIALGLAGFRRRDLETK